MDLNKVLFDKAIEIMADLNESDELDSEYFRGQVQLLRCLGSYVADGSGEDYLIKRAVQNKQAGDRLRATIENWAKKGNK